jgi:hypothetical protein
VAERETAGGLVTKVEALPVEPKPAKAKAEEPKATPKATPKVTKKKAEEPQAAPKATKKKASTKA